MKKFILAIFLITSFSTFGISAEMFPCPTIIGSTGLVRMPTADVLPYKNFNIGIDGGVNQLTKRSMLLYKMNLGTFQGTELGVIGGADEDTGTVREGVFVNMKYSLATETSPTPLLLAIGVENLSSYYQTDVYMVATRYFKEGFKLHFGFMGDFPGEGRFRPLGMLGLELPPWWEKLVIMGDVLAGESMTQFDLGARYFFTPILALSVSGLNVFENEQDHKGKDPKSFLLGFSWANPF